MAPAPGSPRLAVIIPAYNAATTLGDCLAALGASERRPDEVVLFDDGSTDATAAMARAWGARVIGHDGPPLGPGAGRNAAVEATTADIVVFVDADVAVHPGAIGRLEAAIRAEPGVVAAFGSYDDTPRSQRGAALYANLRHHFVHQRGAREATTFWAGLGAIERVEFQAVGGFDPRYRHPSIEDIELGVRLHQRGLGLRLVREAQGKHCKDWGLRQLWRTDVQRRAAPWTELIAAGATAGTELNLVANERQSAIAAHLVLLGLVAAIFAGWPALVVAAAALGVYVVLNAGFLALLRRRGGTWLALRGLALHLAYHVYASVTFAVVMLRARLRRVSQNAIASTGSTQTTRD